MAMLTSRTLHRGCFRSFALFTRSLELRGKANASLNYPRQGTHWRARPYRDTSEQMEVESKEGGKAQAGQLIPSK